MEAHAGRVGVHSEGEGKGTTFFFELPVEHFTPTEGPVDGIPQSSPAAQCETVDYDDEDDEEEEEVQSNVTGRSLDHVAISPKSHRVASIEQREEILSPTILIQHDTPTASEKTVSGKSDSGFSAFETRGLVKYDEHDMATKASCAMTNKQLQGIGIWRSLSAVTYDLHILIADDSALSRKLVSKLLLSLCDNVNSAFQATYNFDIEQAKTGKDAYDKVLATLKDKSRRSFDLVLIDFYMPIMNGAQAALAMRSAGFSAPIMAVTSCTNEVELSNLHGCGVDVVLQKPFTIKKFFRHFLGNMSRGT